MSFGCPRARIRRRFATGLLGVVFGLFHPSIASPARQAPGIEVKGVAGYAGFLDEATIPHRVVGAAVRLYASAAFSIEPEFLYMRESRRDQDYVVQANFGWDFTRRNAIQPYVVGGIGLLHHRARFPGARDPVFSSNRLTVSGGGGLRIHVSDRLVFSPEFRLGWEPLYRATLGVGYRFGR